MLSTSSLKEFVDALGSGSPTPGGGGAAALAGALGSALTNMVCNFTTGEKYAELEPTVRQISTEVAQRAARLVELVDGDAEAFGKVTAGYDLPRSTAEEKARRSQAIQDALKDAAQVPMAVVEHCHRILELDVQMAEIGNKNVLSDIGVSILMADAAMEAAAMNVNINLAYIKDEAFNSEMSGRLNRLLTEARGWRDVGLARVRERIFG